MTAENTAKVWRQADNEVTVIGTVVENNLEIKQFDEYKDGVATGSKYNAITGDLVVRSGENENHTIRFFSKELRNDGKPNGQYAGLVTVKDTVVSIADTEKNKELTPTRVRVTGSMELNEYVGQDLQLRSFSSIQGRFVNRLEADDQSENKAEFDVEGLVGKVIDEFDRDGVETGRKKVTLLIPLYSSVIPVEFVVGEGQGADYIEENFLNGTSVRVYGDVVNFRKETKREVVMGFGENKIETDVSFVNENLIKGGSIYEEGLHDSKIIDAELVKQKLVEREVHLENLKTRAQQRQQGGGGKPKTGFGNTPAAPKKPAQEVDVSGLF